MMKVLRSRRMWTNSLRKIATNELQNPLSIDRSSRGTPARSERRRARSTLPPRRLFFGQRDEDVLERRSDWTHARVPEPRPVQLVDEPRVGDLLVDDGVDRLAEDRGALAERPRLEIS